MRRSLVSPAAATLLVLSLAGCSGRIVDPVAAARSRIPPASTAIVPDSPRALLDAFAHAWNNRDAVHYGELFTDDFRFQFAPVDTEGNPFPGGFLTREEELRIARHLFLTGSDIAPPAQRIVLTFDRTFIPEPDSRPGKTWPWHQEIKRSLVLSIDTGDQAFRITGAARFFVVRGDSAAIPPDLAARGFHADLNRWYIERWEDETLDQGGIGLAVSNDAPTPTKPTTWGSIKLLYR